MVHTACSKKCQPAAVSPIMGTAPRHHGSLLSTDGCEGEIRSSQVLDPHQSILGELKHLNFLEGIIISSFRWKFFHTCSFPRRLSSHFWGDGNKKDTSSKEVYLRIFLKKNFRITEECPWRVFTSKTTGKQQ